MKTKTQLDYQERVLRVLVHIQQHLDEARDPEHLARIAGFSMYHFHRIFRALVGESLASHYRRLRLERAAVYLRATDKAITQLAFDAGYETHEAFTRAFRAQFGMAPTEFRAERAYPHVAGQRVHYVADGALESFEPVPWEDVQMDAKFVELEPFRVAFMRHVGPYQEVGALWQRFGGWAGMNGLFKPGKRVLGMAHDDPEVTPPDKIRYDACIEVDESFQPSGEVGVQEVRGGAYAMTVHEGPYDGLANTYCTLMGQWLPAQSRETADAPCFEIYVNNPMDTKPEDLRTEVYVPVK